MTSNGLYADIDLNEWGFSLQSGTKNSLQGSSQKNKPAKCFFDSDYSEQQIQPNYFSEGNSNIQIKEKPDLQNQENLTVPISTVSTQRKIPNKEKKGTHNFISNLKPLLQKYLIHYQKCRLNEDFKKWQQKKSTNLHQITTLFKNQDLSKAFEDMFSERFLNRQILMMKLKNSENKRLYLKKISTLEQSFKSKCLKRLW